MKLLLKTHADERSNALGSHLENLTRIGQNPAEPSMRTIPLADAKNNLSRLVDEVADGHEIIIAKHGRPMARLIPVSKSQGLRFGLMKGQIRIADDFDDELAGFEGRE